MQPLLVPSVLLALPPSVRILELNTPCAGAVLNALGPFILKLHITGNGADISWGNLSAAASVVLAKLVQLRMDFRQRTTWEWGGPIAATVLSPPRHIAGTLVAATRLSSLALCASWSDNVPAL